MNKLDKYLNYISPNRLELMGNPEDGFYTEIIDEELDVYKVNFNYDNCAFIITEEYTHIVMSSELLIILANLIKKADRLYKAHFDMERKLQK